MSKRAKRYNWEQLVKDYDTNYSNYSKSRYCREKGLSASSFCKWYLELGKNKTTASSFIKISKSIKAKKYFYVKLFGIKLIKLELCSV